VRPPKHHREQASAKEFIGFQGGLPRLPICGFHDRRQRGCSPTGPRLGDRWAISELAEVTKAKFCCSAARAVRPDHHKAMEVHGGKVWGLTEFSPIPTISSGLSLLYFYFLRGRLGRNPAPRFLLLAATHCVAAGASFRTGRFRKHDIHGR